MAATKMVKCATPDCGSQTVASGPPACVVCWYGSEAMAAAGLPTTRQAPGVPIGLRAAWWAGRAKAGEAVTKALQHAGGLA